MPPLICTSFLFIFFPLFVDTSSNRSHFFSFKFHFCVFRVFGVPFGWRCPAISVFSVFLFFRFVSSALTSSLHGEHSDIAVCFVFIITKCKSTVSGFRKHLRIYFYFFPSHALNESLRATRGPAMSLFAFAMSFGRFTLFSFTCRWLHDASDASTTPLPAFSAATAPAVLFDFPTDRIQISIPDRPKTQTWPRFIHSKFDAETSADTPYSHRVAFTWHPHCSAIYQCACVCVSDRNERWTSTIFCRIFHVCVWASDQVKAETSNNNTKKNEKWNKTNSHHPMSYYKIPVAFRHRVFDSLGIMHNYSYLLQFGF